MSKHSHKDNQAKNESQTDDYRENLHDVQVELVKLQNEIIRKNSKILILFEGRDAAGKDGTIKHMTEHLSPRETRIVALGKPSDRDKETWYFQRFVPHLPAAQEMVLFNRSWYNRAGVESVMGFCTHDETSEFLYSAPIFEQMLTASGILLFKYYLDISRNEQKKRLKDRRSDPLKQWKISPIDNAAQDHWEEYSAARNSMFSRTHHASSPWTIVSADDKHKARINLIKDVLFRLDYKGKNHDLLVTDPNIVFSYEEAALANGLIAK